MNRGGLSAPLQRSPRGKGFAEMVGGSEYGTSPGYLVSIGIRTMGIGGEYYVESWGARTLGAAALLTMLCRFCV